MAPAVSLMVLTFSADRYQQEEQLFAVKEQHIGHHICAMWGYSLGVGEGRYFILGYDACKVYILCLNFCCHNKHFLNFIISFQLIHYSIVIVLYSEKFLIQLIN